MEDTCHQLLVDRLFIPLLSRFYSSQVVLFGIFSITSISLGKLILHESFLHDHVDKLSAWAHVTSNTTFSNRATRETSSIHTHTHQPKPHELYANPIDSCHLLWDTGNVSTWPGPRRVLEELHSVVGFDDWESLRWRGKFGLFGDSSRCVVVIGSILWFQKFGFFFRGWIDGMHWSFEICVGIIHCHLVSCWTSRLSGLLNH